MDGWGRGAPLLAGRYRLDELIGRDRIAEVWRGHDLTMGRSVTIKLLTGRQGPSEGDVQPRLRSRVSRRVGHSIGDRVLDVGTQDGRTFVVLLADDSGLGAAASGWAGPPSPHLDPYGDSHGHEGWPTGSARPRDPADPPRRKRSDGSADGPSDPGHDAAPATAAGPAAEDVPPWEGGGLSLSSAHARTPRPRRLRVGMIVVQGAAAIVLIGSSIWLVTTATPSRPSAAPPVPSVVVPTSQPSLVRPTASPSPASSPAVVPPAVTPAITPPGSAPRSPAPSGSAPATSATRPAAVPTTRSTGPATRSTGSASGPATRPAARRTSSRTAPTTRNRVSSRSSSEPEPSSATRAASRSPKVYDRSATVGGPPKQPPGRSKHSDNGPKLPNGKTPPGKAKGRVPPGLAD